MFSENTLLFILFLQPPLDVDQHRIHHGYAGVCLEWVLCRIAQLNEDRGDAFIELDIKLNCSNAVFA